MDLKEVAAQLHASFPDASIETPLLVLGEGFGSKVVETANGIVFRIAKHEDARQGHRREQAALSVVQQHVRGLRVPQVQYYLDASDDFPYGVIGYSKLPGRPLQPDDIDDQNRLQIAGQLAGFMTQLHGIHLRELGEIALPRFPPSRERLVELGQNVLPYLEQHLSRSEYQEVRRWWTNLLDIEQRYPYLPTLVHGDLWYENLLFDDANRKLVGVIDFTNVSIGDPAIDLATQRYIGDQFARAVIKDYYRDNIPTDLAGRINDLMVLRELLGLEHGILTDNVDEDAVSKVTHAVRVALG
jgi:aminoglycoside 2''-phosphotransferase